MEQILRLFPQNCHDKDLLIEIKLMLYIKVSHFMTKTRLYNQRKKNFT